MQLSLENIESDLNMKFHQQVTDVGIIDSSDFLRRWLYLSTQVTRLHGAALARVKIPDIQGLLAEIAYGECGSGNRSQIHSKLLTQLMQCAPNNHILTKNIDSDIVLFFEDVVSKVCQMSQDQAIGFVVGLEAPAYEILKLLKTSLVAVGIEENVVSKSSYMVIHDAVEKEHQESGHEAMKIVLDYGCDLRYIYEGGNEAIHFLTNMVGLNGKN